MTLKNRIAAAALCLSALTITALASAAYSFDGKPVATFKAKGTLPGLSIDGKIKSLKVADDGSKLTFTVPLVDIDTGIDKRNEHMREKYLNKGDKKPDVTLTVDKGAIAKPEDGKTVKDKTIKGSLSIKGEPKDVSVVYTAKNDKGAITVDGTMVVDLAKWDIKPTYAGVGVDQKVDVAVHFVLKDK